MEIAKHFSHDSILCIRVNHLIDYVKLLLDGLFSCNWPVYTYRGYGTN
jgi:hypothetical protein